MAIAVPLPWQIIGYSLLVSLIAAVTFLSVANYARVETVGGTIAPDKGISTIIPSRVGVITVLNIHDGDVVAKDAPLATIRVDEDLA